MARTEPRWHCRWWDIDIERPSRATRRFSGACASVSGHSGPIVVGSRLVYTDQVDGKEIAHLIDLKTRKEIWRQAYDPNPAEYSGFGTGPRSTPTVDGDRVYVQSGRGKLACLSMKDGSALWAVRFREGFWRDLVRQQERKSRSEKNRRPPTWQQRSAGDHGAIAFLSAWETLTEPRWSPSTSSLAKSSGRREATTRLIPR